MEETDPNEERIVPTSHLIIIYRKDFVKSPVFLLVTALRVFADVGTSQVNHLFLGS